MLVSVIGCAGGKAAIHLCVCHCEAVYQCV